MDNEVTGQGDSGEEILVFDVSDDALERAASVGQNAFTMPLCTMPFCTQFDCYS
jgi:hypothetical protein